MMKEEKVTSTDLQDSIDKNPAVIIYFYSDKCAPCISLRPKVKKLINDEFPKINLQFVNAETSPEITGSFGIFSNPTIIVFFDGKEYRRYSKYISMNELSVDIERVYNILFEE